MANVPTALSEVIGFEETDGRLYLRLRSGTRVVLDANGEPLVINDPALRKRLALTPQPVSRVVNEEAWDPWRQGP